MDTQLTKLITHLAIKYDRTIHPGSQYILEVDLGHEAEQIGYGDLGKRLRGVEAVVPVKEPAPGMKVLIDGRTFINYAQYDSGIAVPEFVARDIDLPATRYTPGDSLIRQFH